MTMLKKYLEYLQDNPGGYWFKRKLYGWGWVPATREGWTVLGLWFGAVTFLSFTLDENAPLREVAATFILPLFFLTALLLYVCYKKGEKPRWQWGMDKKDE